MKKKLLFAIFLLVTLSGFSQVPLLKSEATAKALSKQVTDLFKEGRISESFAELKKYWPLNEEELGRIEQQTVSHLTVFNQKFGKPIRAIKYREEKIGDMALREVYFIQYQYTAIRLVFTYYHNAEGWIVHAFKWNDTFSEEFE